MPIEGLDATSFLFPIAIFARFVAVCEIIANKLLNALELNLTLKGKINAFVNDLNENVLANLLL